MGMLLSQEGFASALKENGAAAANKRLIQRWESGQTRRPQPPYIRALEAVTGMAVEELGFSASANFPHVSEDGSGGHDVRPSPEGVAPPAPGPVPQTSPRNSYNGVWLSRYEFYSSGRDETFVAQHYVLVLQRGNRLTVRSLPGASTNPDSPLTMDLTVDGSVITGTWVEQTATDGYYRGARYHGAIQMLVEPTGTRMVGKWVGFGKDMDTNTGPWALSLQDPSTTQGTLARYSRRPE
jgi:hypothetical protein